MFKKLNNESGAILMLTLTFVLAFTSLGIAAIYHAGKQNEMTELLRASTEAFWLADGAVQRAMTNIPNDYNPSETASIGSSRGQYYIFSDNPTTDAFDLKWFVETKGVVNGQIRTIKAEINGFPNFGVLNTNGPVDNFDPDTHTCSFPSAVNIDCSLIEAEIDPDFTFFSVFPDATFPLNADQTYTDNAPNNAPNHYSNLNPLSGLTVINIETPGGGGSTPSVQFNNSKPITGTGFVLIDMRTANLNGKQPDLKVEFSNFGGILWVMGVGSVSIRGTTPFNGAIFIDGGDSTRLTGTPDIIHDLAAIDDAVSQLEIPGGGTPGEPAIAKWEEVGCSNSMFGC